MVTRKTGFTLIELLVVIAIIAVIAAILFPVFAHICERGRQTTCASNLRQIGMATMQYVEDNNETMFPRPYEGVNGRITWSSYSRLGQCIDKSRGMLGPYLKSDAAWICPSVNADWPGSHAGLPEPTYGLNFTLSGYLLHPAPTTAQVEASSETILAAESEQPNMNVGLFASPFIFPPSVHQPAVCGRHFGQANVLWLDGHINARRPATAFWSKGFMDVATQERLHLGDILTGPYTGNAQADDYYYKLVKPAGG